MLNLKGNPHIEVNIQISQAQARLLVKRVYVFDVFIKFKSQKTCLQHFINVNYVDMYNVYILHTLAESSIIIKLE